MSILFKGASYQYPGGDSPACSNIDLTIAPGELILLTGRTGCGKSTLLRLGAGLLQRHGGGQVKGAIGLGDADPGALPPRERVKAVAFVAQEPRDQLVAGTVGDEVAFGMESAGFPPEAMDPAIMSCLKAVNLAVSPERRTTALSGGQTQRLIVAAALSAGAPCLLLDEPLAQLDPKGAKDLLAVLEDLKAKGVAILLVEHRLEAAIPVADRIVVMDQGQILGEGPGGALEPGGALATLLASLDLWVPDLTRLREGLGRPMEGVEFEGEDGQGWRTLPRGDGLGQGASQGAGGEMPLLEARGLRVSRGREVVLKDVDLQVNPGERIALVGPNGAGKSTLLLALAGALKGGDVTLQGRCLSVPQDPDLTLFNETVFDEIAYALREQGVAPAILRESTLDMAQGLGVDAYLNRPPQALSRGQRQRVAVAAALIARPDLLLVDEPTAGLHRGYIHRVLEAMDDALGQGALIFATHDLALAARWGTRVLVMGGGRLLRDAPPDVALRDLPPSLGLSLPPLMALCEARGLPFLEVDGLVDRARLKGGQP